MNPYFIAVMVAGALLPMFAPRDDRRRARRVFWAGVSVAAIGGFLVAFPPDWRSGLMLAGLAIGLMLLRAYFSSPYLKFRGKIYAFSVADSQPDPQPGEGQGRRKVVDPAPDSYGGMASAAKSWRLMVPAAALCSYMLADYVFGHGKPSRLLAFSAAAVLVLMSVFRGYEDASWGYTVARGQRLQFAIITVLTVGGFAVLYLPAYYAGRRWPRRPKRSMEYRAHPRHWK